MKIIFKILKVGSGSDIYFKRLKNSLESNGVKVRVKYFNKVFQYFPFLMKFFDDNEEADIIHSSVEYGWVFKKPNNKLISTLYHNVFEKYYFNKTSFVQKLYYLIILRPNIKKTLKVSEANIAISKFTKRSFSETFKCKNIQIIYPGIDLSSYKIIKTKKVNKLFQLLFVGNLINRKGADLLPKIMKLLGNEYVLYYTSGLRTKPPSNFSLPNMIRLGKLSEEELIRKYNECDVLLAPSRLEGFGYQIAEAMACGKPVIAANCSSLPELIINNKGGFLCEIDNVNDFVEKIKILSENKYLMKKMGLFNRLRIIEEFDFKKIGKEYQQMYNRLINHA